MSRSITRDPHESVEQSGFERVSTACPFLGQIEAGGAFGPVSAPSPNCGAIREPGAQDAGPVYNVQAEVDERKSFKSYQYFRASGFALRKHKFMPADNEGGITQRSDEITLTFYTKRVFRFQRKGNAKKARSCCFTFPEL